MIDDLFTGFAVLLILVLIGIVLCLFYTYPIIALVIAILFVVSYALGFIINHI